MMFSLTWCFIHVAVVCAWLGLPVGSLEMGQCPKLLCKQRDATQLREKMTDMIRGVKAELDAEIKGLKKELTEIGKALGYTPCEMGSTEDLAARSCQEIIEKCKTAPPDGLYWIAVSKHEKKQLYCDMTTQGGGWMLVWSFTYTDYKNFSKKTNAVTPRPSWNLEGIFTPEGIASVTVPISTTPPKSEDQLSALEFKHWKTIGGNNLMIKSNLINWISCTEDTGSVTVEFKDGSINCEVIKVISVDMPECKDVTPNRVWWSNCGVVLRKEKKNYMKYSINPSCICQMDPCGEGDNTRYIKDLEFPRVNFFIK